MFQWKTSKLRLNKRHKFVCGLNNLSFVTYHDMFAGEYQVGYGRFHGVEKLHSSSYVNGESQCLILIHNYTYNTHKYVVATIFTIYIYWDELSMKQFSFVDCNLLYLTITWFQHYIFKWPKKHDTFYLFLHVGHWTEIHRA